MALAGVRGDVGLLERDGELEPIGAMVARVGEHAVVVAGQAGVGRPSSQHPSQDVRLRLGDDLRREHDRQNRS
jgi:hypothetical protein